MKGWACGGAALLILGAIVGAFFYGQHVRGVQAERDQARAVAAQRDADNASLAQQLRDTAANARMAALAEAKAAQQREATATQFRTITKTVVKYVQAHPAVRSCGLDDAGLRLWNAANAGHLEPAATDAAGKQPAPLPAPAAGN